MWTCMCPFLEFQLFSSRAARLSPKKQVFGRFFLFLEFVLSLSSLQFEVEVEICTCKFNPSLKQAFQGFHIFSHLAMVFLLFCEFVRCTPSPPKSSQEIEILYVFHVPFRGFQLFSPLAFLHYPEKVSFLIFRVFPTHISRS